MKEKGKSSCSGFCLSLVFFAHLSQQKLPHSVKIKPYPQKRREERDREALK